MTINLSLWDLEAVTTDLDNILLGRWLAGHDIEATIANLDYVLLWTWQEGGDLEAVLADLDPQSGSSEEEEDKVCGREFDDSDSFSSVEEEARRQLIEIVAGRNYHCKRVPWDMRLVCSYSSVQCLNLLQWPIHITINQFLTFL